MSPLSDYPLIMSGLIGASTRLGITTACDAPEELALALPGPPSAFITRVQSDPALCKDAKDLLYALRVFDGNRAALSMVPPSAMQQQICRGLRLPIHGASRSTLSQACPLRQRGAC